MDANVYNVSIDALMSLLLFACLYQIFLLSVLQFPQLPQSTVHPPQYHSAIYPHMPSVLNKEGAEGEGGEEYLR
jgi:hypothetical protein